MIVRRLPGQTLLCYACSISIVVGIGSPPLHSVACLCSRVSQVPIKLRLGWILSLCSHHIRFSKHVASIRQTRQVIYIYIHHWGYILWDIIDIHALLCGLLVSQCNKICITAECRLITIHYAAWRHQTSLSACVRQGLGTEKLNAHWKVTEATAVYAFDHYLLPLHTVSWPSARCKLQLSSNGYVIGYPVNWCGAWFTFSYWQLSERVPYWRRWQSRFIKLCDMRC